MAKLIVHNRMEEFMNYNVDYIFENFIGHYNLIKFIENHKHNQIKINNAFNIIDDDGSNILCLVHDWNNFIIYGSKWNLEVFKTFSEFAHLEEFPPGLSLTGTRALIFEIAEYNKLKYKIFKDRLIYKCIRVNEGIAVAEGNYSEAKEEDLEEIALMSYAFSLEEYKEHAHRTLDFMRGVAERGIAAKSIFKWEHEKQITSMAQVMTSENGDPVIGQFFTNEQLRKRGYGTSLLLSLTMFILDNGWESCGVISDATSLASNAIFRKLGYEVIYETISLTKT